VERWTAGAAACALAAALATGAAAGVVSGEIWTLVDAKNPTTTASVNALGASGPFLVRLDARCDGGAVTFIAFNTRVTRFEKTDKGFRIDNDEKGHPAFLQIQALGVAYTGRFEPTRGESCSLDVQVQEEKGRGEARLDCEIGEDAFGLTPFPTPEQIDAIRTACAKEKGISVRGSLKRVQVTLNGSAEQQ
jgi:hypothetical protein